MNTTLSLFMALTWGVLGVGLLVAQGWAGVENGYLPLGDARLSIGWLMLLLALYNLARWWGWRLYDARRRAGQALADRRERRREPDREPDPTFDFSDRDSSGGRDAPGR